MDPFLVLLHSVSAGLSNSELTELKFLCQGRVGKRKLERVQCGLDLFTVLLEQNELDRERTGLLRELLASLRRQDLLARLDRFEAGAAADASAEERGGRGAWGAGNCPVRRRRGPGSSRLTYSVWVANHELTPGSFRLTWTSLQREGCCSPLGREEWRGPGARGGRGLGDPALLLLVSFCLWECPGCSLDSSANTALKTALNAGASCFRRLTCWQ